MNDKFIKYFFIVFLFVFLVLIFDGFYQYFLGKNILGWKSYVEYQVFFGEEEILGSYLSRLWPIFFGLSIFIFTKKINYFYYLYWYLFYSEALIFMSGDRTAFFNINLSAIFVIIIFTKFIKIEIVYSISKYFLLLIISFLIQLLKKE